MPTNSSNEEYRQQQHDPTFEFVNGLCQVINEVDLERVKSILESIEKRDQRETDERKNDKNDNNNNNNNTNTTAEAADANNNDNENNKPKEENNNKTRFMKLVLSGISQDGFGASPLLTSHLSMVRIASTRKYNDGSRSNDDDKQTASTIEEEKKQKLEQDEKTAGKIFDLIFAKVIEVWKIGDGLVHQLFGNFARRFQFGGELRHKDVTVMTSICRSEDTFSFKQAVSALKDAIGAERTASLLFVPRGYMQFFSPFTKSFLLSSISFIDSMFVVKTTELLGQENVEKAMKACFGGDQRYATDSFREVCCYAKSGEHVQHYFDKLVAFALGDDDGGGEEALKARLTPPNRMTSSRNMYGDSEDDDFILYDVLSHQQSCGVVKVMFNTILKFNLLESQLQYRQVDRDKDNLLTQMCKVQKNVKIVEFIFESLEKHLDPSFYQKHVMKTTGNNVSSSSSSSSSSFSFFLKLLSAACTANESHEVVKYLFDVTISADAVKFQETCWGSNDESINNVFKLLVRSTSSSLSSSLTLPKLQVIFAHFPSAESVKKLLKIKDSRGRKLLDFVSSQFQMMSSWPGDKKERQQIVEFLSHPDTAWRKSVQGYQTLFVGGAPPPVSPWREFKGYEWLQKIVSNIDGLQMLDPAVVNFIISLNEMGIVDEEPLAAFDNHDDLLDRVLSNVPNKILVQRIKDFFAVRRALQKQQQEQKGRESEQKENNNNNDKLSWLTSLIKKYSIKSELSEATLNALIESEIDAESFLLLDDSDFKDMKLSIGARKTLLDLQRRCGANYTTATTSPSPSSSHNSSPAASAAANTTTTPSELARRISSEFPSHYIFSSSIIDLGQQLGSGGFSHVYRARLTDCNRPVAVKLFQNVNTEQAIHECKIAMNLHHKNIIPFVGISIFTFNAPTTREEIAAVLELGRGTLHQKLSPSSQPLQSPSSTSLSPTTNRSSSSSLLPWDKLFKYSYEIASGLDYLHNNHAKPTMNHLDLKPANVLFDENNNVRLCDFGLSRVMSPDASHVEVSRANFGTLRWMSPEQMVSRRMAPTNDVYSFGCILYNMIEYNGCPPWNGLEESEIYRKLMMTTTTTSLNNKNDDKEDKKEIDNNISCPLGDCLETREDCPQFLLDLCKSCLRLDYKQRPNNGGTLVEILKRGILDLISTNTEWKQKIGDVSYIESDSSSGSSVVSSSTSNKTTSFDVPSKTQVVEMIPSAEW